MSISIILKKYWFPVLIIFIVIANSFIFLPKYGAWGGPSDVEYNEIAINMASGDGFSISGERTMFREPAYPFFLFLNYKIFGVNTNAVRAGQFILLFLIIYLTYIISYKIFGTLTARIASLAVAGLPIFPIYATDVISEIFATFLVVLFIYIFMKSMENQSRVSPWVAGLVFGILVLTKSIFIFLPILILPIYLLRGRKNGLKNILVFLLVAFIVVSPWVYRNYINFEKVSVADRGGMLLYLHAIKSEFNSKELADYAVAAVTGEYIVRLYNPDFNIIKGEGIHLMKERRVALLGSGLNSSLSDEAMAKDAKELYLKHPIKNLFIGFLEVAKVNAPMAPKYTIMFAFPEDISNSSFEKIIKAGIVLSIRLFWTMILFIALFGAYKALKEKNIKAILILLLIIYLNGVIFFFQGVPRFVFPIYPLYFIFFAFSLAYFFEWGKEKTKI